MSLKDRLYDQAVNALAMAQGFGDEASFGLVDKYIPGAKELGQQNPWASGFGRMGSYVAPIPLPSKLKAATRLPQALEALKAAPSLQKLLSKIAGDGWLKTMARGSAQGVAAGEGQHIVRKALGTTDDTASPSGTADRLVLEGAFGAGGGALGKVLTRIAPAVYNHPAIMNRFKQEDSEKLARELMDEGTWGTLDTFKGRAGKYRDEAGVVFKDIHNKITSRERQEVTNLSRFLDAFFGKPKGTTPVAKGTVLPNQINAQGRADILKGKRSGMLPSEREQYNQSYRAAREGLSPDRFGATNIDEVSKSLQENNTRLSNLKAEARARAQGAQGIGENSAEIDRVKSLKNAHERVYKGKIDDFGDSGDVGRYQRAKVIHRKGADLAGNIKTHEIYNQHSPRLFSDYARNVAEHSIGSAPIRTAAGVILNKVGPKIRDTAGGRVAELKSRNNGVKEEQPQAVEEEANPFMDQVGEPETVPPVDEAALESAKKLNLQRTDLEAVRDPNDPEKREAWEKLEKRRAEKRAKKTAQPKDDEEEEENPFLELI